MASSRPLQLHCSTRIFATELWQCSDRKKTLQTKLDDLRRLHNAREEKLIDRLQDNHKLMNVVVDECVSISAEAFM